MPEPEFSYHSAIGQSAWIDLLRLLKEVAIADIRGTPRLKTIGKRKYWYDQFRVGTEVKDRYIGEDTPEMRARLDRHTEIAKATKASQSNRARLMGILRAEGYLTPDVGTGQIIQAMARTGVFRLGGTLVGTQAFRCYEGVLGVRIGFDQSALTDDIDIASFERLSLALGDTVDTKLTDVFDGLKFAPAPALEKGKVWRWIQSTRNTEIEFLTPSFEEEEGVRDLQALGVSVQSLHFLNYLIAEPIQAPLLYQQGVLIQIPRPERYAIHKLIVANRRRMGETSQKSRKDRAQSEFLIGILSEERPDELAQAYQTALECGPAWRDALAASLARLPETAARLKALS